MQKYIAQTHNVLKGVRNPKPVGVSGTDWVNSLCNVVPRRGTCVPWLKTLWVTVSPVPFSNLRKYTPLWFLYLQDHLSISIHPYYLSPSLLQFLKYLSPLSGAVVTQECVERLIRKDMTDPITGDKLTEKDIIPLQRVSVGACVLEFRRVCTCKTKQGTSFLRVFQDRLIMLI